jgi:thioredoxin 1
MDDELREIRERKLEELRKRFDPPNPSVNPEYAGITPLNAGNFSEVVASTPRLVVDFWAPWCGPCRMLAPVLDSLAVDFAGTVKFAKCNTDENQQIAYQFGISAIPALFFFVYGQVIHQVAGVLPRPQLEEQIRAAFQIP